MFEKLDNCPLCESGHFHNHIICQDHTVSEENFAIVQCDNCSFLFTNPRPSGQTIASYYESDDYISHQNKSNNLVNFVYRIARSYTLKSKLKLINSFKTPTRNILDIGCGTGHFLNTCKHNRWNVLGVEPNDTARTIASKNNIDVFEKISDLPEKQFDIITMWHVLEHIPDINNLLSAVHKRLTKNGRLIVAVPNVASLDAQLYKDKWAAYDVPRHLYHFTQKTMAKMMSKHKFKVLETVPMKLDAFYVSLLSEKYRKPGIAGYLKAIINGCKSNIYATKNNQNYSSLIYIIRKK